MLATTRLVAGSTRETEPSPWLRVQTAPSPTARKRGAGPTAIRAATVRLLGSMRHRRFASGQVTQMAPAPAAAAATPGAVFTAATILLLAGSICTTVPSALAGIHTPLSPT